MRIRIAGKLQPFSHQPGVVCTIPRSFAKVQIFPTLLRFEDREIPLPITGPVKGFTVIQDLEKGCLHVFGHAASGFMRYYITAQPEGIEVSFEKSAPIIIPHSAYCAEKVEERLSLGMHKSQDWDQVMRREDLREILPALMLLGQMTPKTTGNTLKIKDAAELLNFIKAHFRGLLVPIAFDDHFHGLSFETPGDLSEISSLIRSLFIVERENEIALLPALPTSFHAGRFTDIHLSSGDRVSMEWSKKLLKKVIWHPAADREVHLKLQNSLDSFRMRTDLKDKGVFHPADKPFSLKSGTPVYLDRFQK